LIENLSFKKKYLALPKNIIQDKKFREKGDKRSAGFY
jgi:hypothetical protein